MMYPKHVRELVEALHDRGIPAEVHTARSHYQIKVRGRLVATRSQGIKQKSYQPIRAQADKIERALRT